MKFDTALKRGAFLIALYLVVYNASKAGTLFTAGSKGTVDVVKAFQGR
ncbi:MAG: hypothetical protein HOV96_19640 [Nonomuraea sp.]|jgi:hypothetical protein|nr:hypothetical protein [Nonomuraea sp.]